MTPGDLPKLAQIHEVLNCAEHSTLIPLSVAVLRNITVESIEPYLRYTAAQSGLHAQVSFCPFDNIVQTAVAADGPIGADTDVVMVFCALEACSEVLSRRFARSSAEQIKGECERIANVVQTTTAAIRKTSPALILWYAFESPVYPAYGAIDSQIELSQGTTVRSLNDRVRHILADVGGAYLIDLDTLVARVGARDFYDHRYWHIGRAPYARAGLSEIASETMKFGRALKGKARKCLVLDCDDTLWGGIVGEDGPQGVQIGTSYPGSAFLDFQQQVLELHSRGVIIALCSKNNETDVFAVLRDHPEMALREEHIAATRINWKDKISNLCEIATELNIGLDSLVFVDDSPFEVELVNQQLPQVATILLPRDKPAEYRYLLASCGLFDALAISGEDRQRGKMYRAAAERERFRTKSVDLSAYLKDLEMQLQVSSADARSIPRIAQLTQKTNQFNLTTRRYTESDIAAMVADDTCMVLYARLRDRLGDYGVVGVCIARFGGQAVVVDSLLLSCRALGRGVEDGLLASAMYRARLRGAEDFIGEYFGTEKNSQAATFYPRMGFATIECANNSTALCYRFDLRSPLPSIPPQFSASLTTV